MWLCANFRRCSPTTFEYVHVSLRIKLERSVRPVLLSAIALCGLSAGCHRVPPVSQADEIRTALNRFYAVEPACLWTKPITLERSRNGSDTATPREARALVYAGLIEAEHHGHKLTNAGSSFWREDPARRGFGNLCFGKWHADKIDNMVARPDGLFGNVIETRFEATLTSEALWTRVPAMQQAFPLMAMEVEGPVPHNAIMRHTDKGWEIAVIEVPSVHSAP